MTNEKLEQVVNVAMDHAFKYMQDALGVTDGGFAAIFMCGENEDTVKAIFKDYIHSQIEFDLSNNGG